MQQRFGISLNPHSSQICHIVNTYGVKETLSAILQAILDCHGQDTHNIPEETMIEIVDKTEKLCFLRKHHQRYIQERTSELLAMLRDMHPFTSTAGIKDLIMEALRIGASPSDLFFLIINAQGIDHTRVTLQRYVEAPLAYGDPHLADPKIISYVFSGQSRSPADGYAEWKEYWERSMYGYMDYRR